MKNAWSGFLETECECRVFLSLVALLHLSNIQQLFLLAGSGCPSLFHYARNVECSNWLGTQPIPRPLFSS
jgi:hypothetical protein